ncbi:hypothetical protein [Anoxynatronum sibiricum]|uniref:ABC transporter permease n=1 Tax=Anoxynatronum sibiricum TaxID=210623 RepID=A0ABU9VX91_9CLOT
MTSSFLLIRLLNRLHPLMRRLKVHPVQLTHILTLKLTLEDRKTTVNESMGGKPGMLKGMKANLLMQAFIGLFMGLVMLQPADLFYPAMIIMSMNVVMMVMYMVTDFSQVLLDTRDTAVIMTRPVDPRTMNAARIIHVIYYMSSMFAALNLAPLAMGIYRHGFRMIPAFLLAWLFLPLLVIFVTTLLYGFLIRRFTGEKLKDILNVFQVFFSIMTVVGYQVAIRIFSLVDLHITFSLKWWTYLLPPAWYAGLFKVVVEGDPDPAYRLLMVLGMVLPVVLGYWLIRRLLPRYEYYLTKLQVEDGLRVPADSLPRRVQEGLFRWLSKDPVELAFMRFSAANMRRDRKLKLMMYPNHALGMFFPLLMLLPYLQRFDSLAVSLQELRGGMGYLSLYLMLLFLATNFSFLQFSECAPASFIYDTFPAKNRLVIFRAALKAYGVIYMLPALLIMGAIYTGLMGPAILPGLGVILLAAFALLGLRGIILQPFLPFSLEVREAGNRDIGETILFSMVVGGMSGLHFLLVKNRPLWALAACILWLVVIKVAFARILSHGELTPQKE